MELSILTVVWDNVWTLNFCLWDTVRMNTPTKRPVWIVLASHWLSLFGAALVTTAVLSLLFVLSVQLRGHVENPYIGIVIFLILPAIFFGGLFLIPIGVYLGKQRIQKGFGEAESDRKAALRRLAWFLGVTTFLNVLLGTQFTYRAVKHMETAQFCGQSCHSMNPEFAAYLNSPHSKVDCVECHVAPGAGGWIASKTAGIRQLLETLRNNYPRPVPGALESNRLVPASETCEECHWQQKFGSVRLRVITKYAEDEANTRTQTVLLMMVGGSKFAGIHGRHFGPGIHIRFAATDAKRQTIPWVEYQDTKAGIIQVFSSQDSPADAASSLPKYEMQCVDCHNRPTHTFESASAGMDTALALGEIPITLAYIKKKGLELLQLKYNSNREASEKLPQALAAFYQQDYPGIYAQRLRDIQQAAQAVVAIYNRNVFPDLNVGWGTYPNNLGHTEFPGCFRCHDGAHSTSDGRAIGQDCNTCHQPLAMDEATPAILQTLGIEEAMAKAQRK